MANSIKLMLKCMWQYLQVCSFAPELFFADISNLSCFNRIKMENNLMAEVATLELFSDKSCYSY